MKFKIKTTKEKTLNQFNNFFQKSQTEFPYEFVQ